MRDDFFTATIDDYRIARALGSPIGGDTHVIIGGAYRSHVPAVRATRKAASGLDLAAAIRAFGKTATARPAEVTSKGILHVKLNTPDAFFVPAHMLQLGYNDDPKDAIYR